MSSDAPRLPERRIPVIGRIQDDGEVVLTREWPRPVAAEPETQDDGARDPD